MPHPAEQWHRPGDRVPWHPLADLHAHARARRAARARLSTDPAMAAARREIAALRGPGPVSGRGR